ncbi:MAG: class I SAM-dependent methyltransferase [Anaerolineales bacterium]|nr:class I SAM-dependent methyltransferase [Chloroflexota bacterium]MBL6981094.1 class I SAM-dependent methyltransferase [Anaerolineales bacterium]
MSKLNDPDYLLNEQYQNAKKLNARIRLHVEFSINKYGWCLWVFDHFNLPKICRILELGCGPGDLWLENISRIPAGWEITLSDFSPGMIEQARQNLANQSHPFKFEIIDAQSIPYEDRQFDAVIANHFLYHVPDRRKSLSEIHRVLKENGKFFCSTIGETHMQELPALIEKFDPEIETVFKSETYPFTLENAKPQLREWFSKTEVDRYPDDLEITDADAIVDYILSSISMSMDNNRREALKRFMEQEMALNGRVIFVKKDSGIFKAWNL